MCLRVDSGKTYGQPVRSKAKGMIGLPASSRSRQAGEGCSRTRTIQSSQSSQVYTDILAEPAHQAPRGGEAPDARDGHRRSPRLPLNANATDIADRKNPGYAGLKQLGRARERRLWRYPALRWRPLFLNSGMPGHWLRIVQVCVAPVLRHQLFAPKSASAIERSDRACLSAPRVTRL